MTARKIKPLEWNSPDQCSWYADSVIGTYTVWNGYFRPPNAKAGTPAGSSIDDAKAAAQADYEQRILSAFEP